MTEFLRGMPDGREVTRNHERRLRALERIDQGVKGLRVGAGTPSGAPVHGETFYMRTDTPTTANQRLYAWNGSVWVGIL